MAGFTKFTNHLKDKLDTPLSGAGWISFALHFIWSLFLTFVFCIAAMAYYLGWVPIGMTFEAPTFAIAFPVVAGLMLAVSLSRSHEELKRLARIANKEEAP